MIDTTNRRMNSLSEQYEYYLNLNKESKKRKY